MTEHEIQAIDQLVKARVADLLAQQSGDIDAVNDAQARAEAAMHALRMHPDDPDPARE